MSMNITEDRLRAIIREELDRPRGPQWPFIPWTRGLDPAVAALGIDINGVTYYPDGTTSTSKRDLRTREQHERSIGRLLVKSETDDRDLHDPKTE